MKNKKITLLAGIAIFFLISFVFIRQEYVAPEPLYLVGAKIYPSPHEDPIENGAVVIEGGKIINVGHRNEINIPGNAAVIDCSNLTLTAGFWNSHVHFQEEKWQQASTIPADQLAGQLSEMFTRYGFIQVFDLSNLHLENILIIRDRIIEGEVKGPMIFAVGAPITPPDGSPFYVAPFKLPEAHSPKDAAVHVQAQFNSGASGIKMWSASPNGKEIVNMPTVIGRMAVDKAHELGIPVFAHPTNNRGIEIALACGVDILTHVAPEDRKSWNQEIIEGLVKNNTALIPTLQLYKWDIERTGYVGDINEHELIITAVKQLHDYHHAGGPILFGTDVGFMSNYNPLDEFLLMSKAGMGFRDILASLTTTPAMKLGHFKKGRIEKGMDADLVLLNGDPADDIANWVNVYATMRNGEFIYRKD